MMLRIRAKVLLHVWSYDFLLHDVIHGITPTLYDKIVCACWVYIQLYKTTCSAKASLIFSTKNISVFGSKVVKHLRS